MQRPFLAFLATALAVVFSLPTHAQDEDLDYYHPSLLKLYTDQEDVDEYISLLADSDMPPGDYEVSLYVNQQLVRKQSLPFILRPQGNKKVLFPCISPELLDEAGLNLGTPPVLKHQGQDCVDLDAVDFVEYKVTWRARTLVLSVPQQYIDKKRLQEQERHLWDQGIDHASIGYNFSSSTRLTQRYESGNDSTFVNLRPGINLGAWRYRNYSTWSRQQGQSQWLTLSNTLSRDIHAIQSELVLGDSYSSAQLFDSVQFRGAKLHSSKMMLPIQDRTYVPAVTGIANSDARVTIRQNGNIIYQNTVPAGPFSITDYYPASQGGSLDVSVEEVDGSIRDFIVPFATVPLLERKGGFSYSLSGGHYLDPTWDDSRPRLVQGEAFYGLGEYTTLYGGFLSSDSYTALGLGVGANLGTFGALSGNFKFTRDDVGQQNRRSGKALSLNYAKGFSTTDTTLSITHDRYLNADYRDLRQALVYQADTAQEKSRSSLSLSQPLPSNLGSITGSASHHEYRDGRKVYSYNVGYIGSYSGISYSLYFRKYHFSEQRARRWDALTYQQPEQRNSHEVMFTISIPLSKGDTNIWGGYSVSHNDEGRTNHTVRLNGDAYDHRIAWGAYQGMGNQDTATQGGVNGSYRGSFGDLNASYSYTRHQGSTLSYGLSGAATASRYGLVLSPSLSDANTLIVAPNAGGMRVINNINTETNSRGLALIPGLSPYRNNNVSLDPRSLPANVDIEQTVASNLYPTRGALVLSEFKTRVGYRSMVILQGQSIPSGAQAYLQGHEDQPFVISGFNQLYLVSPEQQGQLQVRWTSGATDYQCTAPFDMKEGELINGIYLLKVSCT